MDNEIHDYPSKKTPKVETERKISKFYIFVKRKENKNSSRIEEFLLVDRTSNLHLISYRISLLVDHRCCSGNSSSKPCFTGFLSKGCSRSPFSSILNAVLEISSSLHRCSSHLQVIHILKITLIPHHMFRNQEISPLSAYSSHTFIAASI